MINELFWHGVYSCLFHRKDTLWSTTKNEEGHPLGYHPRRKFDTRAGVTDSQSSEFPPGVGLCPSVASVKPRKWGTVCGPRSPPPLNSIFPPLSGHHGLKPTCCATIYELPPLVAGAVHYTLQKLLLGHWPALPKHKGLQILAGTSTYEACMRSFDKIYRVLPWRNKADVVFAVFLHQFVASKEKSKQWNFK